MTLIVKPERETQNRLIALFRNDLNYRYLGDWRDRPNNSNFEEEILTDYLKAGLLRRSDQSRHHRLRTEAINPNASSTTTTRRSTACCVTVFQ